MTKKTYKGAYLFPVVVEEIRKARRVFGKPMQLLLFHYTQDLAIHKSKAKKFPSKTHANCFYLFNHARTVKVGRMGSRGVLWTFSFLIVYREEKEMDKAKGIASGFSVIALVQNDEAVEGLPKEMDMRQRVWNFFGRKGKKLDAQLKILEQTLITKAKEQLAGS